MGARYVISHYRMSHMTVDALSDSLSFYEDADIMLTKGCG